MKGITFYGTPWHEYRGFWDRASAFGIDALSLEEKWKKIPSDIDVLITHVPPLGVLDWKKKRMGSPILPKYSIEKVKPKLHVFGHCHTGTGVAKYAADGKEIVLVNAAQELCMKPIVIDYYV